MKECFLIIFHSFYRPTPSFYPAAVQPLINTIKTPNIFRHSRFYGDFQPYLPASPLKTSLKEALNPPQSSASKGLNGRNPKSDILSLSLITLTGFFTVITAAVGVYLLSCILIARCFSLQRKHGEYKMSTHVG